MTTTESIIKEVSEVYGLPERLIMTKSRKSPIVEAKHLVMYLCRHVLKMTCTDIGKQFGFDHTAIVNACIRIENRRDTHQFLCDVNQIFKTYETELSLVRYNTHKVYNRPALTGVN